jgi:branched-subunit amino acid permease
MPTYPSSLYPVLSGGVVSASARSGVATTNDPGSYYFSNTVSYQEFKNQVVGLGISTGQQYFQALDANDLANAGTTYNSAAKYPTDLRAGTAPLGVIASSYSTDSFGDFTTVLANLSTTISAYTTAVSGMTATEKAVSAAFMKLTYANLTSKCQKVTFEMNRVIGDLNIVNSPRSQNKFQVYENKKFMLRKR